MIATIERPVPTFFGSEAAPAKVALESEVAQRRPKGPPPWDRRTLHNPSGGLSNRNPQINRPVPVAVSSSHSALGRIGADEAVAVGHLHLWQRVGIHHIVVGDEVVQPKDIGRDRIRFIAAERLRLRPRHCPWREVEDGRRVGPVATDGLDRLTRTRQRANTARELISDPTCALFAMASFTFLRIQVLQQA